MAVQLVLLRHLVSTNAIGFNSINLQSYQFLQANEKKKKRKFSPVLIK